MLSTVIILLSMLNSVPDDQVKLPYVGPKIRIVPRPGVSRAWDVPPPDAAPNRLPYFGERLPGMPETHFMSPMVPDDPRLPGLDVREHQPAPRKGSQRTHYKQ